LNHIRLIATSLILASLVACSASGPSVKQIHAQRQAQKIANAEKLVDRFIKEIWDVPLKTLMKNPTGMRTGYDIYYKQN
jgi:hypothetical protein